MELELLMWLEQLYLWRLQRAHSEVKQEDPGKSPDEETIVSYPEGEN